MRFGDVGVQGTVKQFDGHVGLGIVQGSDHQEYPFHCAQIANGSRTIEVGAAVEYDVIPGPLGRWEAGTIVSVGA